MTVRELIEKLKEQEQEAVVYVATAGCCGCFKPAGTVFKDERGMIVVDT